MSSLFCSFFRYAFLLACLFILQPNAVAQTEPDRWYTVQLLIFKNLRSENFSAERWPTEWTLPDTANSVDLNDVGRHIVDFAPLESKQLSLAGDFDKLKNSSRYEPLVQLAWKQRGLDSNAAVGVKIRAGKKYTPLSPLVRKAGEESLRFGIFEAVGGGDGYIQKMAVRRYSETAADKNSLAELEGTVKIVLGRYLHIYTDLLLVQPVTVVQEDAARNESGVMAQPTYRVIWPSSEQTNQSQQADAGQGLPTLHGFNIKGHRRMRSGEIHHLDHPLLGVLVKVEPINQQ
jgi:hypothetical protein